MLTLFLSHGFLPGTLRSPSWNLETQDSDFSYADLQLDVAPSDGIIFSWEHLGVGLFAKRCYEEFVEISIDGSHPLRFCGQTTPLPLVFQCRYLRVSYSTIATGQMVKNTGFSLRFSLHNDSALPQQLPDTITWNCAVPYWGDFKEHLLCNLLTECVGGEDEAACPYSDGTCPHGYWSAGGSCFSFDHAPRYEMSWLQARDECMRRGDRLPTLNTADKWQAVVDLLKYRRWHYVYVGLRANTSDPFRYRIQWSDDSVAYYLQANILTVCNPCALFRVDGQPSTLYLEECQKEVPVNLFCEKHPSHPNTSIRVTEGKPYVGLDTTRCPEGHLTRNFLACDPLSDCFTGCYESLSEPLPSQPPSFLCHDGYQRVPFTLVCDHRADCKDASDEICVHPQCDGSECDNKQCHHGKNCDLHEDCLDGSDETDTTCSYKVSPSFPTSSPSSLSRVEYCDVRQRLGYVLESIHPSDNGLYCPDFHFQCPGIRYYCMPVYARCNGVYDCPGHQDEADCDKHHCHGLYRCRGSKVCLTLRELCDDFVHCPQWDDELMCDFVCPNNCTCYGLAFFCAQPFNASRHAGLRFLDARGSGMSPNALVDNTMLFYLNLAECNITHLETMNFVNVYHLDLSNNAIKTFAENHITLCEKLQKLILSGNPIRRMLEDATISNDTSLAVLDFLDLSSVPIKSISSDTFGIFRTVSNLNLSNTRVDIVSSLSVFSKLRVLDLRGCRVSYFNRSSFQDLESLSTVYTDNYTLCCPDMLPDGFNVLNCHAPFDEVSSCENLLKSGLYRVSISVITSVIIVGNTGSFVYRVIINPSKKQTSFGLFVTNLCVSDFLMGVFSATIGVADRLYLGKYARNDITWKNSVTCKTAGFLSLLSNEVSILIICLITVDRFLVTRFPFSRKLHISTSSARTACVTAWSVGILLAVTPLLPVTSHWMFYGQTGMCIPLPVTRKPFDGREYSVGIFVILNFVLFLVISIGQISIYMSVLANSMATSDATQQTKDLATAQIFITVAVSSFLCWLPVGLLGILNTRGHSIPDEASVIISVFVFPLNSALNPLLYTVNVMIRRRQRARYQRLLKILLARHGVSTG